MDKKRVPIELISLFNRNLLHNPVGMSFVIRMGLEPMTHSLEGCCSNPTELPDQP